MIYRWALCIAGLCIYITSHDIVEQEEQVWADKGYLCSVAEEPCCRVIAFCRVFIINCGCELINP